jgi:hypothetical protein
MGAPYKHIALMSLVATALSLSMYAGEKLNVSVKIINRQNSDTEYTYVVAGYSTSKSNTNVDCFGTADSVNCSGSTRTTGSNTPAQQVSYHVRGATFSLKLPDGRVAIINCDSKFAEHFAGPRGNRRSCRMPLVDDIQAEFDGDKAKLKWSVSLDGTKIQSETYRILAVLPTP